MTISRVALATVLSCALVFVSYNPVKAENVTLYVKNNTSGYITVNVDGSYGCHTSAGSTCSIPVTAGDHKLHAERSDTGDTTEADKYVDADHDKWVPWTQ